MTRELRVEVLHVIGPDEDGEGLVPELREVAESRYVLVCRVGGRPSWIDRIRAFVRRDPIEAVTVVADETASEGDELSLTVEQTSIDGVYETVDRD